MVQEGTAASFAALDEKQRGQAMARFAVLRPHLEEDAPLTRAAAHAGVRLRTAQRWVARVAQRRPDWLCATRPAPMRARESSPTSSLRWSRAWR